MFYCPIKSSKQYANTKWRNVFQTNAYWEFFSHSFSVNRTRSVKGSFLHTNQKVVCGILTRFHLEGNV